MKEYQILHTSHNILKEGAVFIADSHFNEKRDELLYLLNKIIDKKIIASQLFLMGDMFDFISCESKYFIKRNYEVINVINFLSKNLEIYYLEGNHDFNIKTIFPKVKVYSRDEQPLHMKYDSKNISLSHGDIFVNDKAYDIYCKIIRNTYVLRFINLIDINNVISKKVYNSLMNKKICSKIDNFKVIVEKRVKHYDSDVIIEGHFHQGSEFIIENKIYKNIPSLACSKEFVTLKNNEFIMEKI